MFLAPVCDDFLERVQYFVIEWTHWHWRQHQLMTPQVTLSSDIQWPTLTLHNALVYARQLMAHSPKRAGFSVRWPWGRGNVSVHTLKRPLNKSPFSKNLSCDLPHAQHMTSTSQLMQDCTHYTCWTGMMVVWVSEESTTLIPSHLHSQRSQQTTAHTTTVGSGGVAVSQLFAAAVRGSQVRMHNYN